MPDNQVRVTFEPSGRAVTVLAGTKIIEAAVRAGLTVDTPCGGQAVCGKCLVRVVHGAAAPTAADTEQLDDHQIRDGWRLACQSPITAVSVIHVPATSLLGAQHQIFVERQKQAASEVLPAVRKTFVQLTTPTLHDNDPDLIRLEKKLGTLRVGMDLLRRLPRLLREGGFAGTCVQAGEELIDFEPGDTTARCFGMAFDIGTTTIVGSLLDLRTGEEKAIASCMNPQVSFGDDVLSRIKHGSDPEGLAELRQSVLGAVADLVRQACAEAAVLPEEIYEVTFAGNTTMQHLLCGIDPTQLGQVPFTPAFGGSLRMPAAQLGVAVHPRAEAYVFAVMGGFVGGDTVAGVLSTNLPALEGPVLMVDIGTNGEIVLSHEGKLYGASTAAGPAFEGARISCGMRATTGAIEKVLLDGQVRLGVIGNASPIGLCGSGLIDLAAELLRQGVVSPEGRMLEAEELPVALSPELRRRVVSDSQGQAQFLLGEDGDAKLSLTQRDVRELQLATGAIRAGIKIVCKQAGLKTSDLKRVLIAGGFGSFIRRSNAQRIGLLPTDVHHERITYVGNASLDGAKLALLSTQARRRGEELARTALHVELSQDPEFQMEFAEAMIFPES